MLGILLDFLAAYLLRKYFSTKLQYFFGGLIAGIVNSTVSSFLIGMWLNVPPVYVVFNAGSGALGHTLCIFFFLYIYARSSARKSEKAAAAVEAVAQDAHWDANEARIISEILQRHQHIDLSSVPHNNFLEDNLLRLSNEEIIEKLREGYFDEYAIPSALRVLRNRSKIHTEN